eukprot:6154584-Prymnesium_polylepis.1
MAQRASSDSSWVEWSDLESFRPVRSWRFNLPLSFLRPDARSLADQAVHSSASAQRRVGAYDSLLSLLFAGTAKGLLTGKHAELERSDDEAAGGEGGRESAVKRVDSY